MVYNYWKKGLKSIKSEPRSGQAIYREGKVNEATVLNMLLYTGFHGQWLKRQHIEERDMKEVVTIRFTHGNTFLLATVKVVVGDFVLEVEAISHILLVLVLLRTDVPDLNDLLKNRAQKKQQH